MKAKKQNTSSKNRDDLKSIQYCDLATGEDLKLRLIANLLLQAGVSLEADDAQEIGNTIRDYINKRMLLDHYFWGRAIPEKYLSEHEKLKELSRIELWINTNERL